LISDNPIAKIRVIPAQAGIQIVESGFAGMGGLLPNSQNFPTKWDDFVVLSASRGVFFCWIPACAGMTVLMDKFG